jgi:hypothetical protein
MSKSTSTKVELDVPSYAQGTHDNLQTGFGWRIREED